MRRRYVVGLLVCLFAAVAFVVTYGLAAPGGEKQAQKRPVELLLPADAALYVGWDGTNAHQAAWEKTAAFESLEKSGFLETLARIALSYASAKDKKEAAAFEALVQSIARKGISLAVTLPFGQDEPRLLIVLHGAASLEPALRPMLSRMSDETGDSLPQIIRGRQVRSTQGTPQINWWVEGEHLIIGWGAGVVEFALDVADEKASSITSDANWKKCHENHGDFPTAFCAWVDAAGLVRRYENLSPIRGPQGTMTLGQVLQVLGVDKLGTLSWRYGFRERFLQGEIHLDAPAPRKGLVSLLDQRPISLKDLPPLPAKTSGFTVVSFNWSKAFDEVIKDVKQIGSQIEQNGDAEIDNGLEQARQFLGFDLKQDVFDALGDVVCLYGDVAAVPAPLNMGLAIRVKDSEKLQKAARALVSVLLANAPETIDISTEKRLGREIFVVELGQGFPVRPALCVDKEWIFVGLSAQAVESALLRVDGKQESWKPSAAEQAVLNGAPKEFSVMTLSDPRPTYASIATLAPLALTFLEGKVLPAGEGSQPGRISGKRLALISRFPPPDALTRPQFLGISTWTVDDRGLHVHSQKAVPSLIATVAVGFGGPLLLPTVDWAREGGQQTQSKNHLKQILLACHNYLDVNQGFPAATHPNANLKPEKRFSWQADLLPYLEGAAVYNRIDFNKAWDDEENKQAVTALERVFLNPGIPTKKPRDAVTHYVGLAGIGVEGPTLPVNNPKAGVFAYDRVTKIADITDGTSNTAMVSEASKDFGSWAAGGRPTIRSLTNQPYFNGPDGIGGPYPGGCNIAFADGSVRFVSTKIDPKVFEALVTIAGGEAVDLTTIEAK